MELNICEVDIKQQGSSWKRGHRLRLSVREYKLVLGDLISDFLPQNKQTFHPVGRGNDSKWTELQYGLKSQCERNIQKALMASCLETV